ncbi:MAG: oxidoreductase [Candidatus Odinarchaeota archaeon]
MATIDLSDEVVFITGALGLLGKEFVSACLKSGARVIAADITDVKDAIEAKNRLEADLDDRDRERILYTVCDITKLSTIEKSIKESIETFGKITSLVNSAYPRNKNFGRQFEEVTYEDFCENVNLHLGGYFLVTREIAKVMKQQQHGNIINIASIYGFKVPRWEIYEGTNMTVEIEYAAIKGALIHLTGYLASYLGPFGIRVNAISPGGVFDNQPQSFIDRYTRHVVYGKRMATTDDISGVLVFLLSKLSNYITGQNIVVDGGWTL